MDYGHPLDECIRLSGMVNAMFKHKLKTDFEPEDIPLILACLKLSRQVNRVKRDNMVDLAGYAWVTQAIIDERARRYEAVHKSGT